jgi:hypothetical protein
VGEGLQMQTDIAVDPAGNVWAINNWQDIESCIGTPNEALSTRCSGQGVVVFLGNGEVSARTVEDRRSHFSKPKEGHCRHVCFGSRTTDLQSPRHVRFSPVGDRIAARWQVT